VNRADNQKLTADKLATKETIITSIWRVFSILIEFAYHQDYQLMMGSVID
jgi:hypothetical protein